MKVETFIKRPVLSTVISILIVLIGIISLITLPVEQYPNIAPPQVVVSATYTGASASTVQKSVIVPIEEAINGVENMDYMTSTATNSGSASITVYFKQGTDPDMAAVNVQNRVATAQGLLPAEVTKIGVTTFKRQNSMLEIFALYSPDNTYDATFISNYMKINLQTQVARIPGVGEAYTLGNDYAMRIWLNPEVMAQYNLVPSDITAVLGEQNIEASTGALGENSENIFQYNLNYTGRLEDVEQFENMVITSTEGGEVLRLKDVAEIELGAVSYQIASEVNGHPGSQCIVFQTAGSNATEVVNNINAFLDEQKENLPKGLEVEVLQNVNDFLYASISEVIKTLIEAIILVTLVVYFFLQDYKATLIPTISLVVSLVGTFIAISLAGFSINLLTLFALILAIGVVVDDAIVVVEAVQTKLEEGYQSSYLATRDAMNDVTNAIITCSLVFMAVFVPVCFTGGTAGIFYTQFGITLAVAVGISAINALTLSPALCAILMKPANAEEAKKKSFSNKELVTMAKRIVNKAERNAERYDAKETGYRLFEDSQNGKTFDRLMPLIVSEQNIILAYRNICKNSGSKTPGTDGKTIVAIQSLPIESVIKTVRNKLNYYQPKKVRRVEIPKDNGKTRPLGIPSIWDRLIQQCILQILEPICEAKFHERNNGFRPYRSTQNAIAQCYKMAQLQNLHFVVDVDIVGFFDNINHSKLIRQLWGIGIQDRKLIMIIKQMLKAEILFNDIIISPETGTPQGGYYPHFLRM